jgi:phosphatidylethanolamine/phosphatidyl-N-methylethanolamine N-methyltransferase
MENIRQIRERSFWDRFARFYDVFMKNTKGLYGLVLTMIRQELGEEFLVLDLAAGTGILALELAPRVQKVYGIDISSRMIALAEAKAQSRGIGNVEFTTGDAYQLPFPDGRFDAVVISNALHVMIEPEQALGEAHRVLKRAYLVARKGCGTMVEFT